MKEFRIVVADDNPAFLNKLTAMLAAEFHIVGTATDGVRALEIIRELKPHIAVLDLEMPGLNGIEIVRAISNPNTPVVICSTEVDPEIVEAVRQAGALGYISKARIEKDLIAGVESALQGKSFFSSTISRD